MGIELKLSEVRLGLYAEEKLREAINYREKAKKDNAYFLMYSRTIRAYHLAYNRLTNPAIKEHLHLMEDELDRRTSK